MKAVPGERSETMGVRICETDRFKPAVTERGSYE